MSERFGTDIYDKQEYVVFYCDECREPICDGETYYEINGEVICKNCIDNMTTSELLDFLGYEDHTASA